MFSVFSAVMHTSRIMTDLVCLHGLWPTLPLPLPVLDRNSKCEDALLSASATAAAQCSREQSMLFMALWDLSLFLPSHPRFLFLLYASTISLPVCLRHLQRGQETICSDINGDMSRLWTLKILDYSSWMSIQSL